MFKLAATAFIALLFATSAVAQRSSPTFTTGQVPTAAQWNAIFAGKLDYNPAGLPVSLGGTGATTATAATATNVNALPAAGPVLGRELVPGVQSGAAVKMTAASIANLATVNVKAFGAKVDGVTNDNAALQAAYTYLGANGGGFLYIPAGTLIVASSNCAALTVPNNVTTYGAGVGVSVVKVTGSAECANLFYASNPNNVWFMDLTFYGNSVASTPAVAGALLFEGESGSTAPMANFGCIRCGFSNFKQDYWFSVWNYSAYPMAHIRVLAPVVQSFSGNMRNPTDIHYPSDVFSFRGQFANLGGAIDDVIVSDGGADGTWIKTYCVFWSGVSNAHCDRNKLHAFGANTSTNSGGYAILAYGDDAGSIGAAPPTNIWTDDNTLESPFSAGVYTATAVNVVADRNICSGQTDTNVTLPKGCIAFNDTRGNSEIADNMISACYAGIAVQAPANSMTVVANNQISGLVANASGIKVLGNALGGTATVSLNGDNVALTGSGSIALYLISATSASPDGTVNVVGGQYGAGQDDIYASDNSTSNCALMTSFRLVGVRLAGAPTGGGLVCAADATPIAIDGLDIDATSFGASAFLAYLPGETALNISSLTLRNTASNSPAVSALQLTGAEGSMPPGAVKFINIDAAHRVSSTDFGAALPTWAADNGTLIANLTPVGGGVQGWQNVGGSTTWLPLPR